MDDKEKHYSDIYISVLSAEPSVQYLAFSKMPYYIWHFSFAMISIGSQI